MASGSHPHGLCGSETTAPEPLAGFSSGPSADAWCVPPFCRMTPVEPAADLSGHAGYTSEDEFKNRHPLVPMSARDEYGAFDLLGRLLRCSAPSLP